MVCTKNKCQNKKTLPAKKYNQKVGEFKHHINQAFDNFFNILSYPITPVNDLELIEPNIDIIETDNDIKVSAELPGINENDIDINLSEDGYLTIQGEKKNQTEEKSNGRYFSERSYGMISRTIPLPTEIDINKADAKFSNGVLKIIIPKTAEAKQKIKKLKIKK